MKNVSKVICILILLCTFAVPCFGYDGVTDKTTVSLSLEQANDSTEEIYKDMAISLLIPHIQNEINKYYEEYLTELPTVFPYSIDVIKVEREYKSGYLIKLEVIAHPFVGPMNTVEDDRLIIETGALGSVEVKKFEHLKSYQLPWNWQHIVKKPF